MALQLSSVGSKIVVAAAIVIVLAGIKAASAIVIPFLLSVVIAVLVAPLFLWLKQHGVPEWPALGMIVLLVFASVAFLTVIVGNSVQDFTANVPQYEAKLRNDLRRLVDFLRTYGISIPKDEITDMLGANQVMPYVAKTFKSFGALLTNLFLIVLTVIFLLLEIATWERKLRRNDKQSYANIVEMSRSIKHFVVLKSFTSLLTGALIGIALSIQGVHYALLWGIVAFLLNYIPNIGSIIAALPAVLMSLIQFDMVQATITASLFVAVNVLIGSILEPRIMGKGLGLSPLVVFLSLLFWGWLLGPIGMLLSVPLTMMVKIVLQNNDDTKRIADMLGND